MKRILRPGINCMGIYGVRQSGLIVDSRDYYLAFYEAAKRAKHYIVIAGWQFNSNVTLLRGKDAEGLGDTRLLPFLNQLCDNNPELNIYILAWDFAEIYLTKREWFQEWIFNRTANKRIHFRFDDRHAIGASHHEKFVVIDGVLAFVSGTDICADRWDDRRHLADNPNRKNPKDEPYEPYHDIQSCHVGPVAQELVKLFKVQWEKSGGGMLDLIINYEDYLGEVRLTLPIAANEVAISRTRAKTIIPSQDSVQEIRNLYIDALGAAEKLIYIENQYFSSGDVYRALMDRLRSKDRSRLQIVVILPKGQHSLMETIAFEIPQAKKLKSLMNVISSKGHSIGVYYSVAEPRDRNVPVYIHSKLLIVDDRFLTMGSANLSNRSMGLDTELNISWEAYSEEHEGVIQSIRKARASLLKEHTGLGDDNEIDIETVSGLVERLNKLADSGKHRLMRHKIETVIEEHMLAKDLKPDELMLDPRKPVVEENVLKHMSNDKTGIFSNGITLLSDFLVSRDKGVLNRLFQFMWKRWWAPIAIVVLFALVFWMVSR